MNYIYIVVRGSEIVYIGSSIRVAKDKARPACAPLIFKVSVSFADFVPQFTISSVYVHSHNNGDFVDYSLDCYHRYFRKVQF